MATRKQRRGPLSAEHRANIAAALNRPDVKARMSAARKGHEVRAETRAKMSAAQKGRPGHPQSPETRAKIAATLKGRRRGIPGSAAEGGGK